MDELERIPAQVWRELFEGAVTTQREMTQTMKELTDAVDDLASEVETMELRVLERHRAREGTLDKLLAWSQTKAGLMVLLALVLALLTLFGVTPQDLGGFVAGIFGG